MYKRIFFLLFAALSLCFLSNARPNASRTIFTVWDEFVKLSNSGADDATSVQDYFRACIKENTSPETFYNVKAVDRLSKAAREFRDAADKLDEMKRRIEHPIPKGTMTAKK